MNSLGDFKENLQKNSRKIHANFSGFKSGENCVNFSPISQKTSQKIHANSVNLNGVPENSQNSQENSQIFHSPQKKCEKNSHFIPNSVNFLENSQKNSQDFHILNGSIDFRSKPLFLAPMAGFSDLPFRQVVKQFGADVTVSEMISANALVFDSKKTLRMLEKAPNETPFIVQIAGASENIIKKAVLLLNEMEGIAGIDFNCGCPAPKVVRQNAGAALLCDLPRLRGLVATIKAHSKKRYTSVKMRLGFAKCEAVAIAAACEAAGADFIAIHGRTRAQFYEGACDFDAIKAAKAAVSVPIIANGDINAQNCAAVLERTNADGAMLGRACVGKPWLFWEIKNAKRVENALKKGIVLCHLDAMLAHYGLFGLKLFRKHLHSYSKGIKAAAKFRELINKEENANNVRKLIEEFL